MLIIGGFFIYSQLSLTTNVTQQNSSFWTQIVSIAVVIGFTVIFLTQIKKLNSKLNFDLEQIGFQKQIEGYYHDSPSLFEQVKHTPEFRLQSNKESIQITQYTRRSITLLKMSYNASRNNLTSEWYLFFPKNNGNYLITPNSKIALSLLNIEQNYGLKLTKQTNKFVVYGQPPQLPLEELSNILGGNNFTIQGIPQGYILSARTLIPTTFLNKEVMERFKKVMKLLE